MKYVVLIVLLAVSACASGPVKFPGPSKHAKTWDLNVGQWPGTNDLVGTR